jgi:hypothetical protein
VPVHIVNIDGSTDDVNHLAAGGLSEGPDVFEYLPGLSQNIVLGARFVAGSISPVLIFGTKKALAIAIKNNKTEKRSTLLSEWMKGVVDSGGRMV